MTSRILPRDEYGRLVGTELETVYALLPETAQVLVVEDGAVIVACWALYPLLHAEGIWIHPEHRGKASVARRLLVGMGQMASAMGADVVNTAAVDATVAGMLDKLGGVVLPGVHYAVRIRGTPPCQPE